MDGEFWAARLHRHIPSGMMEEEDEEVRTWFPCPFCYLEIEVQALCSHLQQEHCFDLKNAVCPICAANLGKDPLSHFTVQHVHSIKRRRKSQKSGFWNSTSANIIRDLRDLTSFLSQGSTGQEPVSDPVLSPFLCTTPMTVAKDTNDNNAASDIIETSNQDSYKSLCGGEDGGQDYEEKGKRAAFLQELLLSTVF